MTKEKQEKNERQPDDNGVLVCAMCGGKDIDTSIEDMTFPYGVGKEKVDLSARVPVRKCANCGFTYRDVVADRVCHDVVCHHLGVMTPAQIRSLRGMYSLTQAQFATATRLGEATLSRWERGILIQNGAYDSYLYLLGFLENMDRLQNRGEDRLHPSASDENVSCDGGLTRRIPTGFPAFKCKGVYARS
jgi:hypothetical protein